MKLSRKCDYALRALLTLADNHEQGVPISVREIAERNDIPKRFLEHILLELNRKGWVKSRPGRNGGYILGKNPKELTMGDVIRQFDGVLAPVGCVSTHDYKECTQESTCRFRQLLVDIQKNTVRFMDGVDLSAVSHGDYVIKEEMFSEGAFI